MVYKILSKLTLLEYLPFLDQMGKGTHARKISHLIWKSKGEIDRDEIFQKVFKRKRDLQNDYLLRNEMSILKRRLETYVISGLLVDVSLHVEFYRSYAMAQWCLKKGLTDESEKYLKVAISIARKNESWQGLLQMSKFRLQATQYSKSDYHAKLELMHGLAEEHMGYLKELVANEVRYADFIKAGAVKLAANLRKTVVPFSSTLSFSVDLEKCKSTAAHYYHYKSLAYASSGLKAVGFLEKALEYLKADLNIFSIEEERLTCRSAMAMEYSVAGELKKSERVFENILMDPRFEYFPSRNVLLFNYCTTLLKLKEYQKALLRLEELENLDVEPIVLERIYTMKCNCYIFMEDVKGIKRILPNNLQSYDLSVRSYYRFLYVIYYLIKGENELAERELGNIKHMRGFGDTDYVPLSNIFEKYIAALNAKKYKEKDASKKLVMVITELQHFKNANKMIAYLLPGTWIEEKIVALNGK